MIGSNSFAHTALRKIFLPDGLEEIGDEAFSGSGIKVLFLPKTVRRIGKNIAYRIKNIYIFDNIETDIGKDNDLSANAYTLYVHSAESDKIKYAVPLLDRIDIFGFNRSHARQSPVKLFKKGADFDFREYDRHFLGEQPLTGGYDFGLDQDKFNAVKLRLRYGRELDEETRLKYQERYIGLIKSAFFFVT